MKNDPWKHLQMAACVLMLVIGVACSKPVIETDAISEGERAAVVAGLIMGMDLSVAIAGGAPLESQRWDQLQKGFNSLLGDCKTVRCVTDTMVAFREKVRSTAVQGRQPKWPEVIR